MKKLFTLIFAFALFLGTSVCMAQNVESEAEKQTKEMAERLKLNEGEYLKLRKFNLERLEKIYALGDLREKDNRYLDLRLDQIEEEYNSLIFNTLNTGQYTAFMKYREEQPFTYAGLTMKNNTVAQSEK